MAERREKSGRSRRTPDASFGEYVKRLDEPVWGLFPCIGAGEEAFGCQSYALIVID
ncbi:UNVERIFIED_ORG: hypothetical protein J3D58_003783 [Paenarthrobacter nicotinovorans]|uniref:Uncharacterized protein n=1 Tax=Paenarthrobacter histidinolovorans TaxID=43664 RepID=A0ABW8NA58_9MICC